MGYEGALGWDVVVPGRGTQQCPLREELGSVWGKCGSALGWDMAVPLAGGMWQCPGVGTTAPGAVADLGVPLGMRLVRCPHR